MNQFLNIAPQIVEAIQEKRPVVALESTNHRAWHGLSQNAKTAFAMKACIAGGQVARRYKVPYRTSNTCAANAVDAQAAYESVFSLWGVTMGGGNFIMHGAGWLEGGLVASFEKFILDCDLIQMVMEFLEPLATDPDALADYREPAMDPAIRAELDEFVERRNAKAARRRISD